MQGLKHIINENKDFYSSKTRKNIPKYDILVTNPPYSGDHKQRLLEYLSSTTTPYCLLLPAYTAGKSYWRDFASSSNAGEICYLLPEQSYMYYHPGDDISIILTQTHCR